MIADPNVQSRGSLLVRRTDATNDGPDLHGVDEHMERMTTSIPADSTLNIRISKKEPDCGKWSSHRDSFLQLNSDPFIDSKEDSSSDKENTSDDATTSSARENRNDDSKPKNEIPTFNSVIESQLYASRAFPAIQSMQDQSQQNTIKNRALHDYQMQLKLLEQTNKKRLMICRQEQHVDTQLDLNDNSMASDTIHTSKQDTTVRLAETSCSNPNLEYWQKQLMLLEQQNMKRLLYTNASSTSSRDDVPPHDVGHYEDDLFNREALDSITDKSTKAKL